MLISQVVHFTFSKPRGDDLGSNAKDTEKVVKLLTCDAYGTSEILQTLRERLNAASQDVLQAFLTMLAELFDDTLPSTSLAAIERSFVEVLVKMHDVAQVMSDSTIPARLGRIDPMSSFTIQQAPSDFESSLSIWGCVLTSKHRTIDRWTDALVEEMGVWLQYVRAALDERNVRLPNSYKMPNRLIGFRNFHYDSQLAYRCTLSVSAPLGFKIFRPFYTPLISLRYTTHCVTTMMKSGSLEPASSQTL